MPRPTAKEYEDSGASLRRLGACYSVAFNQGWVLNDAIASFSLQSFDEIGMRLLSMTPPEAAMQNSRRFVSDSEIPPRVNGKMLFIYRVVLNIWAWHVHTGTCAYRLLESIG